MLRIRGLSTVAPEELQAELDEGARFLVFKYCCSLVIFTVVKDSDVYFIRSHQFALLRGMKYTLLTLIAGWWGFPWGPILSIYCVFRNLLGGEDVTDQVLAAAAASVERSDSTLEYLGSLRGSGSAPDGAADFLRKLKSSGE